MHRRISKLALALLLFLAATVTATAPKPASAAGVSFKDVAASHWAYAAIGQAAENGWVDGYTDGTFRPAQLVTEAEFLKLLLGAAVPGELTQQQAGEAWSAPYYRYAEERGFPLAAEGAVFDRGGAAQLIAALKGENLGRTEAVQYLLDNGLSSGIDSATVEGYRMTNRLSRAEAVQFIANVLAGETGGTGGAGSEPVASSDAPYRLRGVGIGDTEAAVIALLGEPNRRDPSEYGFQWYIYNKNYAQYAQIGISGGKVVALFSNANVWESDDGIGIGTASSVVTGKLGAAKSLSDLNTNMNVNLASATYPSYEKDGAVLTFMLDDFNSRKVMGIYIVEQATAAARSGTYGNVSKAVLSAYEREIFDLTNVARVQAGQKAFAWDDKIAATARNHSTDMGERAFFAHENPDGESPFDRMDADGIVYSAAGENIAAGLPNAIFAHAGWMNSEGHRKNILNDKYERLGVGNAYSTDYEYRIYYAQNFYTPG